MSGLCCGHPRVCQDGRQGGFVQDRVDVASVDICYDLWLAHLPTSHMFTVSGVHCHVSVEEVYSFMYATCFCKSDADGFMPMGSQSGFLVCGRLQFHNAVAQPLLWEMRQGIIHCVHLRVALPK